MKHVYFLLGTCMNGPPEPTHSQHEGSKAVLHHLCSSMIHLITQIHLMGKVADGALRAIMMILMEDSTIRLCKLLLNDIKYFIQRISTPLLTVMIEGV